MRVFREQMEGAQQKRAAKPMVLCTPPLYNILLDIFIILIISSTSKWEPAQTLSASHPPRTKAILSELMGNYEPNKRILIYTMLNKVTEKSQIALVLRERATISRAHRRNKVLGNKTLKITEKGRVLISAEWKIFKIISSSKSMKSIFPTTHRLFNPNLWGIATETTT